MKVLKLNTSCFIFALTSIFIFSCDTEETKPLKYFNLSATASPSEGGTITFSTQSVNYKEGEIITLTADPKEGWIFQKWEGDLNSTSTSISLTMNSDKSISAFFTKKETPFKFKLYTIEIENSPKNIGPTVHSIYYQTSNAEYFLEGGDDWNDPNHKRLPLFRLKRAENKWLVENTFYDVDLSSIRHSEFLSNGAGVAIADTGPEWPDIPWPHSNLYIAKFSGDNIKWEKVSKNVSFYHDVSVGDLNQDGIIDVAGAHLGTRFGNSDNPHVYFQTSEGDYTEQLRVLPADFFPGSCCGDVEIYDIDGDLKNELIAIGGQGDGRLSIRVMKYNPSQNKFDILKHLDDMAPPAPQTGSYSSIKTNNQFPVLFKGYMPSNKRFYDINRDGIKDMIMESDGLTIWYGQGNLNYNPFRLNRQGIDLGAIFEDYYPMAGYDIIDLENDNDPDIVTRIFTFGSPKLNKGIDLSRMIYINNIQKFDRLVSDNYFLPNSQLNDVYPDYLKAIVRNGKLWLIGPSWDGYFSSTNVFIPYRIMLEIETDIPASYWYESP